MGVPDLPTTTLDSRFSDPQAVPMAWEKTRHALETAELFWLSTVRPGGHPHVTPLVGVWLDGALHFSTGSNEQKTVNLRGNPHVVLTTGHNDRDRGVDVTVEGTAVQVTDNATLTRLAAAWTLKWDGRWHYAVGDGCFHHQDGDAVVPEAVLVFSVTPAKVFAFAKGSFSQTRHQF